MIKGFITIATITDWRVRSNRYGIALE